ncbi:MAG: class I SAM-dependent methyltransferase [Candidatus Nanohaloarchaea archaeon]
MGIEPENYYNDLGHEEWDRSEDLFVHSIEHENTYPYLEEHLPEEGHILDAGGAAGRYTVWLAEKGYKVTLVDISEEQLKIAEQKLKERGLLDQVDIQKGDIRDLDFREEKFDAVLCLGGPLSHVIDDEERDTAANELIRVTKKEHPVFVSVMGFYGCLMIHVLNEWSFIWEIEDFNERQKYDEKHREKAGEDDPGFANTYFFKSHQLENVLQRNGLEVGKMIGLENVVSVMEAMEEDGEIDISGEYKERLRTTARILRDEEASPDLSNHILAVGWKKY